MIACSSTPCAVTVASSTVAGRGGVGARKPLAVKCDATRSSLRGRFAAAMAGALTMENRFLGCLLAGACGDALGEPVELVDIDQISQVYGPSGVKDLCLKADGKATFTDDTQMTLFTAEGLLSGIISRHSPGVDLKKICAEDILPAFHQSYLRWLATQNEDCRSVLFDEVKDKGVLVHQERLRHRRGPGKACLVNLSSGVVGTVHNRINNSKGCGGVMRVAPCGLVAHSAVPSWSSDQKAELAFELGCVSTAITHSHPTAWLSAGCQAAIISRILSGDSLVSAIDQVMPLLVKKESHEETLAKILEAKVLAREFLTDLARAREKKEEAGEGVESHHSVEDLDQQKQKLVLKHVTRLGTGLISEEALGIALYCALITQKDGDVGRALCYAVNHSGDSDSTGAIAGNLVGALHGEAAIPIKWRDAIEMRDLITDVCRDLLDVTSLSHRERLCAKYPFPVTVHDHKTYY